jgi:predicted ATPase
LNPIPFLDRGHPPDLSLKNRGGSGPLVPLQLPIAIDAAWHWLGEAMAKAESSQEKWAEAEIHRVAGELALRSPAPDAARAESYFTAIARQQQAKS